MREKAVADRAAQSAQNATRAPLRASSALARWLIRMRAYFLKEVRELRRQPLLIMSLIGGPLIVLLAFGASYTNSNPVIRTIVVVPPGGVAGISNAQIASLVGTNFTLIDITDDRAAAEARLHNGEIDALQVLPADPTQALSDGTNPQIEFRSNTIDPLLEGWVQYLAYAETNEINKALLRQQAQQAQIEAKDVQGRVTSGRSEIGELAQYISPERQAQIQRNVRALRQNITTLEQLLPAAGLLGAAQERIETLRRALLSADASLAAIDQAISDGTVQQRLEQLQSAQADLEQLAASINIFVRISPDAIVAPVQQTYTNIRGGAYSAVVYYAPGVLALLVQHTAITLGALALVRERLMGAFEVFRVAPVTMIQLLVGKYLGYTLFIALTAAVLIGALLLLGVPLLGSALLFAGLILLLTVASLGVGFLISSISSSDGQAIQLAMITLLLSIFFSGFFISLDSFVKPALALSYAIPMTHGVAGFQRLMLRGLAPNALTWLGLATIALATFVFVVVQTRRQLQKA